MTAFSPVSGFGRRFTQGRARYAWWIAVVSLVLSAACWRDILSGYSQRRGHAALDARRIPEALNWLTYAESLRPTDRQTQFSLARAYRLSGRMAEMQTHLQLAQKLGFPPDRLSREQTLAIAQSGKIREIELQLADMFSSPGEDGREICEAAVCGMFACYRLQEATAILDAWRRDFPSDAQPDIYQGQYNFQKGAWLNAVESFEKAIHLAPDRVDVRLNLADALLQLQRLEEAGRQYQFCLQKTPRDPNVLVSLGRCLFEQGELVQSQDKLAQALAIEPMHPRGTLMFAKLKLANGQADEALPFAEKAFSFRPYDPEVRYVFAQTLQATGRNEQAREHFDYLAAQQEAQSKLRNMLEELERNPNLVDLRYNIGMVLLKYGNPDEGVEWLRSVLEFAPKHLATCRALAQHFRDGGREADAVAIEQRAGGRDIVPKTESPSQEETPPPMPIDRNES